MKNIKDSEEVLSGIIKIVQNVIKGVNIDKSSSQKNVAQWDSLAYMAIVSELEAQYGIEITQTNIASFSSVESIYNLVIEQNKYDKN